MKEFGGCHWLLFHSGQPQFFLSSFILNHQAFILHPSAFILKTSGPNAIQR